MVIDNFFIELSLIVIVALLISIIMRILKQPLIISYIIAGIIIGPYFLNINQSIATITTFSQLGIALLLFMVGLNLNPKVIKEIGKVALITGIGQIIFTFTIGFIIVSSLGFSPIQAAYLAIAISFSSTIIVIKLLSDKGDTESLYGRIATGFLIVQDIIAILILIIISTVSNNQNVSLVTLKTIISGTIATSFLILISVYILPKITSSIAKSQELLLLFSISWLLAISVLFSIINFSIEIGALIAGVTLSLSPYRFEINAKIKPLRDFFLLIFFIFLGSQMKFVSISQHFFPIIILSLLILIGNPIIMMILMGTLGYKKRTSFLAGLTVSQISEFSFIIIAAGTASSQLPQQIIGIITIIGLITMAGSTYMIMHAHHLYNLLSNYLRIFERKGKKLDEGKFHIDQEYDIVLFGYNRIGYSLVKSFQKIKKKFLVIDFNPETINFLVKQGIDCRYGDAEDLELLEELPLKTAKMVVSTIPELETNVLIINTIKQKNKNTVIIVVAHQIEEAIKLYEAGASYVIIPHFLGGTHTSYLIEEFGLNHKQFLQEKEREIKELKNRIKIGHHPPHHERT